MLCFEADVVVIREYELKPSYTGIVSPGYHGFMSDIPARLLWRRVSLFKVDPGCVLKIWVK